MDDGTDEGITSSSTNSSRLPSSQTTRKLSLIYQSLANNIMDKLTDAETIYIYVCTVQVYTYSFGSEMGCILWEQDDATFRCST